MDIYFDVINNCFVCELPNGDRLEFTALYSGVEDCVDLQLTHIIHPLIGGGNLSYEYEQREVFVGATDSAMHRLDKQGR